MIISFAWLSIGLSQDYPLPKECLREQSLFEALMQELRREPSVKRPFATYDMGSYFDGSVR